MKIAAVPLDVVFADPVANLAKIREALHQTHAAGAVLTIFPECAVTGYGFETLAEGAKYAEPIPGPTTRALQQICGDLGVGCVTGLLEADGERVFNSAVLVDGTGVVGSYRKVHLPYLGIDRFATPGDRPFAVCEFRGLKIGMLICYDIGFPEAARTLGLLGADLILLPTNWPPGAECQIEHVIPTRAMENLVYVAAVNRIGTERGFRFLGGSSICAPSGAKLAKVDGDAPTILYAEIDPAQSRAKRIVRVPNKHIIDRIADRRPEMYGQLTQPHHLKRPRDEM